MSKRSRRAVGPATSRPLASAPGLPAAGGLATGGASSPAAAMPSMGAAPAVGGSEKGASEGPPARASTSRHATRHGPSGSSSHSADGSPRAGRRARVVHTERSFLERYRTQIVGFGAIAAIMVVGAFVFIGATQPAYACSIEIAPASPNPAPSAAPGASATPALGQSVDDMGRSHVAVGTQVHYTFCPPASGPHYNSSGQGPIAPRYYNPNDTTIPEGWVHNLEHGALVVLYNCNDGGCDSADQSTLQQFVQSFPPSPVCKVPAGVISPVVTRFDTMKAPFAAVVWDHVLFQQKLDVNQILAFYNQYGDRSNPEDLYCNPNASPSPSAGASGSAGATAPGPTSPPTTARPAATGTPAIEPVPSSPAPSAT